MQAGRNVRHLILQMIFDAEPYLLPLFPRFQHLWTEFALASANVPGGNVPYNGCTLAALSSIGAGAAVVSPDSLSGNALKHVQRLQE